MACDGLRMYYNEYAPMGRIKAAATNSAIGDFHLLCFCNANHKSVICPPSPFRHETVSRTELQFARRRQKACLRWKVWIHLNAGRPEGMRPVGGWGCCALLPSVELRSRWSHPKFKRSQARRELTVHKTSHSICLWQCSISQEEQASLRTEA